MIITVRGTGGAGKTTFVKRLAALYTGPSENAMKPKRKRPYYTVHHRADEDGIPLITLGHYETPTGGCDTLDNVDEVFSLAKELAYEGDVVCEGIMLSEEYKRSLDFHLWMIQEFEEERLLVLNLNTPIDRCLKQIQQRREASGNARPLNPANTERRLRHINSVVKRLKSSGVSVKEGSFDELFLEARRVLCV